MYIFVNFIFSKRFFILISSADSILISCRLLVGLIWPTRRLDIEIKFIIIIIVIIIIIIIIISVCVGGRSVEFALIFSCK